MPDLQGVPPRVLPSGAVLPNDPNLSVPATDIGLSDPAYLASLGQGELRAARGVGSAALNSLNSLWDFVKFPGDVAAGKYSLDEISRMAPGYALGLAGLSTPTGAATVPENALGLFGGSKSLTAPIETHAAAELGERIGLSPEAIKDTTGWFRGPDSRWRYTISDEAARLNPLSFRPDAANPKLLNLSSGLGRPLSQVYDNPNFFAAYPDIAKYYVRNLPLKDVVRGASAGFAPETKEFFLSGGTPEQLLSDITHEAQHAIQGVEGFVQGARPTDFLPTDFYPRTKQWADNAKALKTLVRQIHPNFSDREMGQIHSMLAGDMSPEGDRLLARLNPMLRSQLLPLSREALELKLQKHLAHEDYLRVAGEVEARAAQEQLRRRDWTTPIWRHEGYIPFSQQIVKTPRTPGYNLVPVEHDPFQLTPVDHDPFEEGATQ